MLGNKYVKDISYTTQNLIGITFICICNSKIVQAMKIMWQSSKSQVFRQLNFSNIRREKIVEVLLQRFEDNYRVNLT